MRNQILLILFLTMTCLELNAQVGNPKALKSIGLHLGLNYTPFWRDANNEIVNMRSIDLAVFFHYRYNLLQLNDSNSFGIDVVPSIGTDAGSKGYLGIGLPIMVTYNLGAGATYDSFSSLGLGLGFGIDLNQFNLIKSKSYVDQKDFYAAPCFQVSLKLFSEEKSKLFDLFVRYTHFKNNFEDLDPWAGRDPLMDPEEPGFVLMGLAMFFQY